MTKREKTKRDKALNAALKQMMEYGRGGEYDLANWADFVRVLADIPTEAAEPLARRLYQDGKMSRDGLIEEEAVAVMKALKKIIDERVEKLVQKEVAKRLPGEYPLSTQLIKQTLNPMSGLKNPSFVCKDEHKLTAAHFKLEHAFLSLLEETSEDKNPESEEYFTGNLGADLLKIDWSDTGGKGVRGVDLKQAQTQILPRDVFRAYYGKGKLSGAERKNVWRAIDEYRDKNFTWVIEGETEDGRILRAEVTRPRIEVELISITDRKTTDKIAAGDEKSREAEQLIRLKFHPAFLSFRLDGGKYAKVPKNLNSILEAAAGGARKVSAAHYRLFHYLNSLRSSRRAAPGEDTIPTEIGHAALIEKLGLSHYLESRNGHKLEGVINDLVTHLKAAGLIQHYKERAGNGGSVHCFYVYSSPVWLETKKGGRTLRKGG